MAGAQLTGTMREPLQVGDAAVLSVRPEDLVAVEDGNGMPATVVNMEYRGRAFFGLAKSADGSDLYFRAEQALPRGASATLQPAAGRALLFKGTARMSTPSLRSRLAARGFDGTTLLVLPGLAVMLGLFIYPFFYGLADSVMPKEGGAWYANYATFFSDPFQYRTIASTLWLALPVTIVNLAFAVPIAFRVRLMTRPTVC